MALGGGLSTLSCDDESHVGRWLGGIGNVTVFWHRRDVEIWYMDTPCSMCEMYILV